MRMKTDANLDRLCMNAKRFLSLDMVESERYAGHDGVAIGMNRFGGGAPAEILHKEFSITAERAAEAGSKFVRREGGEA
jgi:transketolase